jgi:hypothetical protein
VVKGTAILEDHAGRGCRLCSQDQGR